MIFVDNFSQDAFGESFFLTLKLIDDSFGKYKLKHHLKMNNCCVNLLSKYYGHS